MEQWVCLRIALACAHLCSMGLRSGESGWKVFEGVARLAQEVLKISPFVEGGVIQDEHGIGRPLG
jgi:hypothetical protein